ncbi:MAG: S-formylglutathione hydrolase [Gammaproteobacteria bacterium]
MKTISENRCFGGIQGVYEHHSAETKTPMRFAVYTPPQAMPIPAPLSRKSAPVLWWLSGLTCTEQNFIAKSGMQRYAAEYGFFVVAPDTSPRGAGVPGEDDSYDFGTGAGFYVDAKVAPWDANYRMFSYIRDELPGVFSAAFSAADMSRQCVAGHSMGGHGALIVALKTPGRFRSVSAFAPICNPSGCEWGRRALRGYLGENESEWREWDAAALIEDGHSCPPILVDQGADDEFLSGGQLRPDALEEVCARKDQKLVLRRRAGYDHSYYCIASFIGEHFAHHAAAAGG